MTLTVDKDYVIELIRDCAGLTWPEDTKIELVQGAGGVGILIVKMPTFGVMTFSICGDAYKDILSVENANRSLLQLMSKS